MNTTEPDNVERSQPQWGRVPRSPALDGLRGVAIAMVALFHYPTHSVFQGGFFGVGLFFVLSGFLLTPIMARNRGRSDLLRFYRRRAWRLLPALVAFLVVFLAAAAVFGRDGWFNSNPFGRPNAPGPALHLPSAAESAAASMGYVYNIFLAHNVPMAEPLNHLWTLAIEGQFYVLWALAVPLLLRRGTKMLMAVTAGLIALSAVTPWWAWHGGRGQNWIYFSSIPRVQELLTGALLAQLWSAGLFRRVPGEVLRACGLVGAGLMTYLVFEVGNVQLKYLGGLTLTAGAGFLIVLYLVEDRGPSWGRRILASGPTVWLGTRSYAIYLWHWPFAMWTNELPDRVGVPLGFGLTLLAAELSWRVVEVPAGRWARRLETSDSRRRLVPAGGLESQLTLGG